MAHFSISPAFSHLSSAAAAASTWTVCKVFTKGGQSTGGFMNDAGAADICYCLFLYLENTKVFVEELGSGFFFLKRSFFQLWIWATEFTDCVYDILKIPWLQLCYLFRYLVPDFLSF